MDMCTRVPDISVRTERVLEIKVRPNHLGEFRILQGGVLVFIITYAITQSNTINYTM